MVWSLLVIIPFEAIAVVPQGAWAGKMHRSRDFRDPALSFPLALHHFEGQLLSGPPCSLLHSEGMD